MRQRKPVIDRSWAVAELHHVQLMALLQELVRDRGIMKTAQTLGVDHRTITSSMRAGRLSQRMSSALGSALQEGFGSAAARQRERNDQLEERLDKMEGQLKEVKVNLQTSLKGLNRLEGRLGKTEGRLKDLRETLPGGLRRLRMSLDGMRKYYSVQRRLIDRRLSALEASGVVTETEASAGGEAGDTGSMGVAAWPAHPRGPIDVWESANARAQTDAEEEMKIIVSVEGGRATIGVQQPSSDRHIETLDDRDPSESSTCDLP